MQAVPHLLMLLQQLARQYICSFSHILNPQDMRFLVSLYSQLQKFKLQKNSELQFSWLHCKWCQLSFKKRLKCYKPCRAAFETKERGKTFQLKMRRESWPPLHQNILNPLEPFEEAFDSISENLALFLLIPCLVARNELVMKREAEPKVLTESTYLNHSADIAGCRKFDSICKFYNNKNKISIQRTQEWRQYR